MATTYQPPNGCTALAVLPTVVAGSNKAFVPMNRGTAIPPSPLPVTLIGSANVTSYAI